jgi:hypothetical protein
MGNYTCYAAGYEHIYQTHIFQVNGKKCGARAKKEEETHLTVCRSSKMALRLACITGRGSLGSDPMQPVHLGTYLDFHFKCNRDIQKSSVNASVHSGLFKMNE